MLTAQEIEEFHLTQEEIDAACERAVEVAVMPKVYPAERAYDIGVVNGHPCIIPLVRAFPGI